jgi:hypothetical protein
MDDKKWDPEEANVSETGSLRYNKGKPEMSQLDHRFLMELAGLFTKAQKKYGRYNWTKGQKYSTAYDSLMRHIHAFMGGQDFDTESKENHLVHAAANIMIMWNSWKQKSLDLDDRHFKIEE